MLKSKVIYYEEEIPDNLVDFLQWEFSSGGTTGEDFIIFARKFKQYIKSQLPKNDEIVNFSRGHYILSGFIKRGEKFVYFSISDVRFFGNSWSNDILIRTAKDENDYTGGVNNSTSLEGFKKNVDALLKS